MACDYLASVKLIYFMHFSTLYNMSCHIKFKGAIVNVTVEFEFVPLVGVTKKTGSCFIKFNHRLGQHIQYLQCGVCFKITCLF